MSEVQRHLDEFNPGVVQSVETIASGDVLVIAPKNLRMVALALKNDLGFDMLIDIVAVDHQKKQPGRYEVNYLFYSMKHNARTHIRVYTESAEHPEVDSITDLYPAADWAEREIYDMMGIHVRGHHNLRRILMWTGFEGHPLRKDYPLQKRQPIPVLDEVIIPEK